MGIRERDWRRLRHDKAIANFHAVIDSNEYRNPTERQKVLENFRTRQQSRHKDVRQPLLAQLGAMQLPPSLSSSSVASILESFNDLNSQEEAEVVELVGSNSSLATKDLGSTTSSLLEDCSTNMLKRAENFREALRVELHYYGALAEKPDLIGTSDAMSKATGMSAGGNGIIEDEELADFFRRAGNLKGTLKKILEGLRKPGLVYQSEAKSVLRLVMKLRAGTGVLQLLEAQGKGGDRSTIQSTLEKLRTGKSSDVGEALKGTAKKDEVLQIQCARVWRALYAV